MNELQKKNEQRRRLRTIAVLHSRNTRLNRRIAVLESAINEIVAISGRHMYSITASAINKIARKVAK